MKIILQGRGISLTPSIRSYVEEKMGSLDKFLVRVGKDHAHKDGKEHASVEARVDVGMETKHHKKGEVFFAECRLRVLGNQFIVRAVNEDLRSAIDEMKETTKTDVRRFKNKIAAKRTRAFRKVKRERNINPLAKTRKRSRVLHEGS